MNDATPLILIGLLACVLCAVAGQYISTAKGRSPNEGAALGLLLGPIGLLIAVLMPTRDARAAEPPRQPEPAPEVKPPTGPKPGRINATARDDYMADALLEFRLRTEGETVDESDPTSTPRRPSAPSRDLRA